MDIQSIKSVKINEEVFLQVLENDGKLGIIVVGGPFGHSQVVVTFEEFQQIVNAMQLLSLERGAMKKPDVPPAPPTK